MTYPRTIDNGGGERLTFVRTTGERLEVESVVDPGAGPPMHVHRDQAEALTVTAGRLGYQRPGQPEQFARPGETVAFGPGDAHRFWNAGEEALRLTGYVEPAGNTERVLTTLFDSQRENGGSRPRLLDVAYLARRFPSEFGMVGVPVPVERVVFPLAHNVGRLLGRYRAYAA